MLNIRYRGLEDYTSSWNAMKQFTLTRTPETIDELWLLEHPAVYTQGQAGKPEHILKPNPIPIVQSDRGGQITYHGPGQLIAYVLMDIHRRQLGVRSLVGLLENIIIDVLQTYQIIAHKQQGAPGVYVDNQKIASIGLRVKNGCTYHGVALNINMDLAPFLDINPCGFSKLHITQMSSFVPMIQFSDVQLELSQHFNDCFGSNPHAFIH